MPERISQTPEQAVIARSDHHVAVAGPIRLVRHQHRLLRPGAPGHLARRQIVHRGKVQPAHRRLEQRGVDHASLPGGIARAQRTQNADHAPHAGGHIDDRRRHAHWRAPFLTGDAHQTGERLHQRIVTGQVLHRPGRAECADVAIDKARFLGAQRRGVESELLDQSRAHVLQHHVGLVEHEARECGQFRCVLEIDRCRALVAIERLEHRTGAVPERRPPVPRIVAGAFGFDLEHGRAQIGEHLRTKRCCDARADLHHHQPGERLRSSGIAAYGHARAFLERRYSSAIGATEMRMINPITTDRFCLTIGTLPKK